MGLSHAEFLRSLPAAMSGQSFSVADSTVTVEAGHKRVRIFLDPPQERRIGLLRLPVTWVTFEFDGYAESEVAAFMENFERHYQRGGG
jgi:hypothetical protein